GLRGPRRPHAPDPRLAASNRSRGGGYPMSDALEDIDREVKENPVVVYMKGTPRFPMCGFSAATVEVLREIGVPYKAVDVLAEADKREAVKAYRGGPPLPQVFVGGRWGGGCDIVRERPARGEPAPLVRRAVEPH